MDKFKFSLAFANNPKRTIALVVCRGRFTERKLLFN